MKHWGLQYRTTLIALVPSMLICLIWVAVLSVQVQQQRYTNKWVQASAIAQKLGAKWAASSNRKSSQVLQALARRSLNEQDVHAITIVDANQQTLVHEGLKSQLQQTAVLTDQEQWLKRQDGLGVIVPIDAVPVADSTQPSDRLGWVIVDISLVNIQLQLYQMLFFHGLLLLLSLMVLAAIIMPFSKRLTQPLTHIIDAVRELEAGNLNVTIKTLASGEVLQLEQGLNRMIAALRNTYDDIQHKAKKKTDELNETLEELQIQNIELNLARREALRASRVKTEFLANMSHEIRTPLNSIMGFSQLLLNDSLSKKQKGYMHTIYSSSQSLLGIINDILDLSKIEAGKLLFEERSIDLVDIIDDVMTLLAPMAYDKQLELVSFIDQQVPRKLIADPLRIRQILINLVNNAIKFTAKGQVLVRVMLQCSDDHLATLKIEVIDSGIGLSAQQQDALFTAFSQAHSATSREKGGTGLGLVIAKRLVERMQGDIGINSELGCGATFWFTLKLALDTNVEPYAPPCFEHKRVLLVEVQDTTATALQQTLNAWAVDVVRVLDTQQADNYLHDSQKEDIHALLLGYSFGDSVQLADLDASSAWLGQIRQQLNCPIIALALTLDPSLSPCSVDKVADYVVYKPIKQRELLETLKGCWLGVDQPNSPAVAQWSNFVGLTVLAVDDNAANLHLLGAFLQQLGCEPVLASNGYDALDCVQQQDIDLILMDVQMPDMNGVTTMQRIRAMTAQRRVIPIIALTALALEDERERLLAAGMDDYLTKPIDESQLRHIILKWISMPDGAMKPSAPPALSVPAENASTGLFDPVQALRRAGNKLDLACDMFHMLLPSLPSDYRQISAYFHTENYAQLQEVLHKLQGALLYCGLPSIEAIVAQMATLVRQQHYADIAGLLAELDEQIRQLLQWNEQHNLRRVLEQAAT